MSRSPWRVPAAFPLLEHGQVHVWRATLNRVRASLTLLDQGEMRRASRFLSEAHRTRYVAARSILRVLLGHYLGVQPAEIRLATGQFGKPHLAGPVSDIRFSLSHSEGMALYAFALGKEVGVDLEFQRRDVDFTGIARRFFTPAEADEIGSAEPAARAELFYTLWTAKEAQGKWSGVGLARALRVDGIHSDSTPAVFPLDAGPGISAAIAVEGEAQIECWTFDSSQLA